MPKSTSRRTEAFQYDVTLSFAGEDRRYVEEVAKSLSKRGVRVFYDAYEEGALWGKDLFQHLDHIYSKSARFCVVFISKHYATKLWTNHEIKSAQARAFQEESEYILPARFDDTEIPGVRSTVGYLDLRKRTAEECAQLVVQKLSPYRLLEFHERERYFPPDPDILYKVMGIRSKREKFACRLVAHSFFESICRMSPNERRVVALVYIHSCPHDYPNNAHISLDLLRRLAGTSIAKVKLSLSKLESLGFRVKFCDADETPSDSPEYVYITWICRSLGIGIEADLRETFDMLTSISIIEIISANYCSDHATSAIVKVNFSAISKATAVDDVH